MLRYQALRTFERAIAGGTDGVVACFALPSGSRLHSISGWVFAEGAALMTAMDLTALAMEIHVLPVLDPDQGTVPDTIWDSLVTKDTGVTDISLDTSALDATPFFEPGEQDWSDVLQVGLRPKKLQHAHKYFGLGNNSIFQARDPETPFGVEWIPGAKFRVHGGPAVVKQPSYVMVGMASPAMDNTTVTLPGVATAQTWPRMKYLAMVLEQALIHMFSLEEVANDDPWAAATSMLVAQLDPDVFESDGDSFSAGNWRCYGEIVADVSVVGEIGQLELKAGLS